MSLPTFNSARDEIQALFYTAWTALAPAANGGVMPKIEWDGVDSENLPSPKLASARFFLKHADSDQATFGRVGERRFTRKGLLTIQIFVPLNPKIGLAIAENLAKIARDAYEGVGTSSGIWFRKVKIKEVGPDNGLYQMNVTAEFQYDEIK